MKKQIIIFSGIVIIFTLLLVWVYLLFFGTPKSSEQVINDLGFGDGDAEILNNTIGSSTESMINTNRPKLRQLTTKPVAGFNEILATNTEKLPTIYYVEMGTGHIYSINLDSGEETRISATTMAGTNIASITNTGEYVIMGNKNNKTFPLIVGKISTSPAE